MHEICKYTSTSCLASPLLPFNGGIDAIDAIEVRAEKKKKKAAKAKAN